MISPKLSVSFSFNTDKLIKKIEGGKRRALMKAGAKQRGIMKRMIPFRKKKKSEPGKPPNAHTRSNEFGLKMILYSYDQMTESVIVGPVGRRNGTAPVPGILDKGGATQIVVKDRRGNRRLKTVYVKARPFTKPSLDIYKDKYPEEYKGLL